MGLSFGDLNADGHLDIFGTNLGDWALTTVTPLEPIYSDLLIYELGDSTSRWFLGSAEKVFTDPGVGSLVATPFGWGTSIADYDSDGDNDIIYHGGMSTGPVVHRDNTGVILRNDGQAGFSFDTEALAGSTDHQRRTVHGVAVGDLDDDGFIDIVSVSNSDAQESIPLFNFATEWGSPFDGLVAYQATWEPTDTLGVWQFSGIENDVNGSLAVEINETDNRQRWAKVRLLGTVGLTSRGSVNRDGIGATVTFTPRRAAPVTRPVLGGASYASQDSLEMVFGLGRENRGDLDILWPGGTRNRLHKVRKRERILFPEIPCSIDGDWRHVLEYGYCVSEALGELRANGIISRRLSRRLLDSALRAFYEEQ